MFLTARLVPSLFQQILHATLDRLVHVIVPALWRRRQPFIRGRPMDAAVDQLFLGLTRRAGHEELMPLTESGGQQMIRTSAQASGWAYRNAPPTFEPLGTHSAWVRIPACATPRPSAHYPWSRRTGASTRLDPRRRVPAPSPLSRATVGSPCSRGAPHTH